MAGPPRPSGRPARILLLVAGAFLLSFWAQPLQPPRAALLADGEAGEASAEAGAEAVLEAPAPAEVNASAQAHVEAPAPVEEPARGDAPAQVEAPARTAPKVFAADSFITKVVGAAAQGAVAACVAALLSAFTEPVVNRLLVERCTVSAAIGAVKVRDCLEFFLTTFPTNMLKFPVFEVINMALAFTTMSGSVRGIVSGLLFCTIMLPVTNYRFRKSMKLPIEPALLYQAYPPTVFRDIAYGWARGLVGDVLLGGLPCLNHNYVGKAAVFGLTIWLACIISSPFNEWRGYWLQPPSKKLPFLQFFKPERYVRSTGVGSTIMGISLFVGNLLMPVAEALFAILTTHKLVSLVGAVGVVAVAKGLGKKEPAAAKP